VSPKLGCQSVGHGLQFVHLATALVLDTADTETKHNTRTPRRVTLVRAAGWHLQHDEGSSLQDAGATGCSVHIARRPSAACTESWLRKCD
jgi:hypothetical protein